MAYGDRGTGGTVASARMSIRADLACAGRICGTAGSVELPALLHHPDELIVHRPRGTERLPLPARADTVLCTPTGEVRGGGGPDPAPGRQSGQQVFSMLVRADFSALSTVRW
jgi:hypothetical protein